MTFRGSDPRQVVEDVWRREAAHVLAALLRRGDSLDDCEDAAQEALAAALDQWPCEGVPDRPRGWLVTVASRRLVDQRRADSARVRREQRGARAEGRDRRGGSLTAGWAGRASDIDDSLQMLVLCAHPVLSPASAVALTLRTVAGLTTRQVAAGLLIPEATAAQRISRAKKALRDAGATFGPVPAAELPRRLHAVRHVLHLIFTAGSTLAAGEALIDGDLTAEAIRLTERLHRAVPRDPETSGLLALMLLVDARSVARCDGGRLVPLAEQDRTRWNRAAIARAEALLEEALPRGRVGPFQLQAAVAAVHADAPRVEDTDWAQILALYRMLQTIAPGPAVDLAAAVALGEVHGPRAGLDAMGPLALARPHDHRVVAAQAHLLDRLGDPGAAASYDRAASLTDSIPERAYLRHRADAARRASS